MILLLTEVDVDNARGVIGGIVKNLDPGTLYALSVTAINSANASGIISAPVEALTDSSKCYCHAKDDNGFIIVLAVSQIQLHLIWVEDCLDWIVSRQFFSIKCH